MPAGTFQNGALRTVPSRHRPRWPYAINADSWQSQDLILCPGFNVAAGNNQTLFDLSEGRRHGAMAGSPIWTHDPQVGECLYFGGSQARRVTWGAVFPTLTAGTVILLVKNLANSNGAPIGFTSDNFNCTHYPFGTSDTGNSCYTSTLHSSRINYDDGGFNKHRWHVWAVTSVNGSVANGWKVFQDGRRKDQQTSPSSITFDSTRRSLGQASDGSSSCQTWSGFIADFRLYNRALSEAEIAQITTNTIFDLYAEIGRKTFFFPVQAVALTGDAKGKATANQTPLGLLEAGRTAGKSTTRQSAFSLALAHARAAGRSRNSIASTRINMPLPYGGGQSYAEAVLATPNLELYWRLNEASGTTVNDSSPRAINGVNSGFTVNQDAPVYQGSGYARTANTQKISVANSPVFDNFGGRQISFDCWFYLDSATPEQTYIGLFGQPNDLAGDGVATVFLYLDYDSNGLHDGIEFYGHNLSPTDSLYHGIVLSSRLPKDQWFHLAATYDFDGTGEVYVNGVSRAQEPGYGFFGSPTAVINSPATPSSFKLLQGSISVANQSDDPANSPFIGKIAEFALYSRALSASEVAAHYNAAQAAGGESRRAIQGRATTLLSLFDALGFGYLTGRSTATGFLTTAVGLNGLSTGRNRAQGDLLLSLAFAGSTFGRGRIPSAGLSLSYALSGIVRANSSAKANVLSVQVPLAGRAMGNGRVLPALDEWRVYAGPRHVRSFTVKIRDSRTFKV